MTLCYFPCDEWPLPLTLVSPVAADPGVRHQMMRVARASSVNTQMKGPGLPGVMAGARHYTDYNSPRGP